MERSMARGSGSRIEYDTSTTSTSDRPRTGTAKNAGVVEALSRTATCTASARRSDSSLPAGAARSNASRAPRASEATVMPSCAAER